MKPKIILVLPLFIFIGVFGLAQEKALVNTQNSPYAKIKAVNIGDVQWTNGFWAERFGVCQNTMVPHMLGCYLDDSVSHAFLNFEIAAGLKDGEHKGPPFHDGDFYKILEAAISIYGETHDSELKNQIDAIIPVIEKAQRPDGYIHTPTSIRERKEPGKKHEFNERLDFETYNMGHLMTAACLHYRITGEETLLRVARKATDFLYRFYQQASAELARNAICPSHYMGVSEMFRTTGDPRYRELAQSLIEIRSLVENGTDHNQDRIPFKKQTKALGHAVRANYLYAGATDVYLETGDPELLTVLQALWKDVVFRKMYITGACGALYDGVSPNGTTYDQPSIQQVHQAYGEDYELPNVTAHNESCANIGNLLWNWRMFLATGEPKYIDVLETIAYNSLLAGVSLDGKGYFYTNPLAVTHAEGKSDSLRWSKTREPYISYCNCCPPNTIRTIAQIQEYAYAIQGDTLIVNLYGGSHLKTELPSGKKMEVVQETRYPWEGRVEILLSEIEEENLTVKLRIPQWISKPATISVNGIALEKANKGKYYSISRTWKKGDKISIDFPMETLLIAANPLVEANRNQIAVQCGPVVYCLDGATLPDGVDLYSVSIPANAHFKPVEQMIGNSKITALETTALVSVDQNWEKTLYQPVSKETRELTIQLIPYYAWGNQGEADMSVWLPLSR
ncbi:MAG TPA: glycoside hydrolase family 127 protein [Prolixibacteraceae bacterium]|nr:glycoside hydrolase family 127 protein [Prolixibacteraceae bacterium]